MRRTLTAPIAHEPALQDITSIIQTRRLALNMGKPYNTAIVVRKSPLYRNYLINIFRVPEGVTTTYTPFLSAGIDPASPP